jgi:hypothetical protein
MSGLCLDYERREENNTSYDYQKITPRREGGSYVKVVERRQSFQ